MGLRIEDHLRNNDTSNINWYTERKVKKHKCNLATPQGGVDRPHLDKKTNVFQIVFVPDEWWVISHIPHNKLYSR